MDINGSLVFSRGVLSDYVSEYQDHLPSTRRLTLLGLVNLPLVIILLHAVWQLVSNSAC